MEHAAAPSPSPLLRAATRSLGPLARRVVLAALERTEGGRLELVEGGSSRSFGAGERRATLHVHDPGFYAYLLLRGSVGAAESYALGHWSCDDLPALVRLVARHEGLRRSVVRDAALRAARPLLWWAHRARRNTHRGSRRNIEAHYDLGNDFFELFLDPSLTYSCAIFEKGSESLEQAQRAKYDRICRKLELGPEHEVLEIGAGWGGFAIHAAGHYGCRVVATTISPAQLSWARERVARAGLADRVQLLDRDYRDLEGRFDRLVSIEMIEAVGADHFDAFFATCSRCLRPDGLMLLQAILTPDPTYAESLRSVDFIKRYIFPGGQLPSVGAICNALACGTDLRLTHLEDLTANYVLTLARWREAFRGHWRRIRGLGYPEPFLRLWELYLSACEGWFAERAIGVAQIALAKPLCRAGPRAGTLEPA